MSVSCIENNGLRAMVDEVAQKYMGDAGNVGLAIGVVVGDQQHAFFYGSVNRDANVTPSEDTVFEIGSIGKVLTTALLADMVECGEVALDDPIEKYMPDEVSVPRFRGQSITLVHLATHTSGLPRLPGNLGETVADPENPYANYTTQHLYEYLSSCRLSRKPGKKVAYSNLGMGLLGDILGMAHGRSYEATVIERICHPLGMTDTTITLSDKQIARLAQGHSSSGKPVPLWDAQCLQGDGAHRSTLKDMLRFAAANLDASWPLNRVLRTCHKPLTKIVSLPPWWRRYGIAIALAMVGVAAQKLFDIQPGQFLFLLPTLLPMLASAFFLGTGAGLLTAGLISGGCYLLWGEAYAWGGGSLFLAVLAWWASSRFRDRSEIGLGWHISPPQSKRPEVIWHNGGTGGFSSFLGLMMESKTAVLVLSNSANSVDAVADKLLRLLHRRITSSTH